MQNILKIRYGSDMKHYRFLILAVMSALSSGKTEQARQKNGLTVGIKDIEGE